jgi:hypothetical protein
VYWLCVLGFWELFGYLCSLCNSTFYKEIVKKGGCGKFLRLQGYNIFMKISLTGKPDEL